MRRIKLLGKIPKRVAVACSGGVDSMAALDFAKNGNREVFVINFDHGTAYGAEARELVKAYCREHDLRLFLPEAFDTPPDGVSTEAYWHEKRYEYFASVSHRYEMPIITCHHLDDQVENWIMTAATGNPTLIPYLNERAGVIRPFLLTRKSTLRSWCDRKSVPYLDDPSNDDVKYTRNLVRHKVMPVMLEVNPGLHKVIARKVQAEYEVLRELRDDS